ncbi:HsdM family class I SAM-dependent methyltransferase [Ensifer sp. LBL]|uniref:HsdM family class I SAM-dependent methyltransferase n=1 Tax=Ensifer sp. LBL TaxID=2991056 RepID=UPI003D22FD72
MSTLDRLFKEMQDLGRVSGHRDPNTPLALLGLLFFDQRLGIDSGKCELSTSDDILRLARDVEFSMGWNERPFSRYLLSHIQAFSPAIVAKWLSLAEGISLDAEFKNWFPNQFENLTLSTFQETPPSVAHLITSLFEGRDVRVLDPACGTGTLLSAALKRFGAEHSSLIGKEGNGYSYSWATIRLAAQGAGNATIELEQVLRPRNHPLNVEKQGFDIILTNPPFGVQMQVADLPPLIRQSELLSGKPLSGRESARVASESAYVAMAYESLSSKGTAALIVPNGFLTRGGADRRIREALIEREAVSAVIGLPPRLFAPITAIETSILVLAKPSGPNAHPSTLFIDARESGYRKGAKAVLNETTVDHIIDVYKARRSEREFSRVVSTSELLTANSSLAPAIYFEHVAIEKVGALDRRSKIGELESQYTSLRAEYEQIVLQLKRG